MVGTIGSLGCLAGFSAGPFLPYLLPLLLLHSENITIEVTGLANASSKAASSDSFPIRLNLHLPTPGHTFDHLTSSICNL
jgi:hypothetical protein